MYIESVIIVIIKEDIYSDSKQKISRFAKNVHVSMMATPDLGIEITQNPKDGTYTLKQGEFDEPMCGYSGGRYEEDEIWTGVHEMGYSTIAEGIDRLTLYQKVESLGVSADCIVERESDLEDFREPVVMHKQSDAEKRAILSEVRKMKVGDELTFTLPDQRTDDGNYVVKGETVSLACIEEHYAHSGDSKLQYVVRDIENPGKTEALRVPMARQVKTRDITGETWLEDKIFLKHHPDGMAFNEPESLSVAQITNVKLNKGRYTKEEINDLKAGKSIDYNKVCERHPIKDKEKYIEYVLESNRPDFTKGEHIARGTIKQEWDAAINKVPNFREKPMRTMVKDGKEIHYQDPIKKIRSSEIEYQKQYLKDHPQASTKPYEEKNKVEEKVRHTQQYAIADGNTDRTDTIITLRRAAKEFELQGKEWQSLADKCYKAADRLPMGDKLDVVISTNMDNDQDMKLVSKKLNAMYPEMDKGLEKLNENRVESIMEDFKKEQSQILSAQLKAQSEKQEVNTVKREPTGHGHSR